MPAKKIVPHVIRRRYVGNDGEKYAEVALNRRDMTPTYKGMPEIKLCRFCFTGQLHSRALHEVAVAEDKQARGGRGVVR